MARGNPDTIIAKCSLGIAVHGCLYELQALEKIILSDGTTKKKLFNKIILTYTTFKRNLVVDDNYLKWLLR